MITDKQHIKTSCVLHIKLGAVLYKNSLVSNSFWHQVFSIHTTCSSNQNWYGLCQSEFDTDASMWTCFVQWSGQQQVMSQSLTRATCDPEKQLLLQCYNTGTNNISKQAVNKPGPALYKKSVVSNSFLHQSFSHNLYARTVKDPNQTWSWEIFLCQIHFHTKDFHCSRPHQENYACTKHIDIKILHSSRPHQKTDTRVHTIFSCKAIGIFLWSISLVYFIDVTKFILGRLLVLIICSHKFFQNVFHAYRSTLFSAHMDKKNS